MSESWGYGNERVQERLRKVAAYDRARDQVKIEGVTCAELVLHIEALEEKIKELNKMHRDFVNAILMTSLVAHAWRLAEEELREIRKRDERRID